MTELRPHTGRLMATPTEELTHPRVVELDPRSDGRWEAFLGAHPSALVYHHPAWLDALAQEYGVEPIGLACEGPDSQISGVLPLFPARGLPFRVEGQGAGRRLTSLPRTPIAGPVATDRASSRALIAAAVERAREENGARLQLKVEGRELDGLVDGLVGVPWLPTYALDLPEDGDAVRFGNSRNHSRIMWSIAKAEKQGIEVRPAVDEVELRAWYPLYLETMRAHAVPPRPLRFFESLWRLLRPHGLMRLLLAERYENRATRFVAGSVFLMFGHTVFYAYTGSRTADLRFRANDLIQWHAIHDAARSGFRRYDLGEVSRGDQGLVEFKKKWGASPRPLYRYYFPPLDSGDAGPLESGSRLRAAAASVWRRLPLKLTAVLGDRLYRYT
jgi:hypothetical protein